MYMYTCNRGGSLCHNGDDICNDFILVKNFGECMDNNNSFAEILTVTKFIIVGVV